MKNNWIDADDEYCCDRIKSRKNVIEQGVEPEEPQRRDIENEFI